MLKIFKKIFFYLFVFVGTGFLVFLGNLVTVGLSPTILMYHGVGDQDIKIKALNISMDAFENQMAFFHRNNYHVISLEELATGLKEKKKFPFKTIVLTFDDGYENNYIHAYPVLKKYGFPATVFVVVDFLGSERFVAGKTVKFLTLDQMREMKKSGLITFGAHSKNHFFLPDLDKNSTRMRDEIFGAKHDLEALLGGPVLFFCYPKGGYNDDVQELVRAAGFTAAVTTLPREQGNGLSDLWALKRVKMSDACVNRFILFIETSGCYMWLKEISS